MRGSSCSKPLVAAVNGHAIAGGCVLAATADRTLMADGGGRIGAAGGPGRAWRSPGWRWRSCGTRWATSRHAGSSLGALTYVPADALALGLVDEMLPRASSCSRWRSHGARALANRGAARRVRRDEAQLRRDRLERMARYADEDAVGRGACGCRRASDGWTQRYLESVTRR